MADHATQAELSPAALKKREQLGPLAGSPPALRRSIQMERTSPDTPVFMNVHNKSHTRTRSVAERREKKQLPTIVEGDVLA